MAPRSNCSVQAIPAASYSSPGEWMQLLQETLGKKEGAAVAASLGRREVIINVTGTLTDQDTQKSDEEPSDKEGNGDVNIAGGPAGSALVDNKQAVAARTEEPDSVLHVVAAAGDSKRHVKCARKIHEKDSSLLTMAAPSSKGDTPLHCAARAGNTNMVAELIKLAAEGGDPRSLVRARNTRGETALHEAVRFGTVEMVGDLMRVDKGLASVELDANDGTSPMYLAVSLGQSEIAAELHKCAGDTLSYAGPRGQNALHAAVLRADRKMTESLLKWIDQRGDAAAKTNLVRGTDENGSTPMHFAAAAADPALQFALFVFSSSNFERYSLGSIYFLPPSWLTKLFEWSRLPMTQLLDADPAAAFQPDRHGSFPVHVAASADSMVSLTALLTRYPTCAGLRDAAGQTFLHVAVRAKRLHAVKFVCYLWGHAQPIAKSVVNAQDRNGDTALHVAVRHGELDMSRCLIGNKHALIDLENDQGETPMDLAAKEVKSGFYFGLSAPRRILSMLTFAGARIGSRRRDMVLSEYPPLAEKKESEKIKDFAQIVGIGSVLVATATFTAGLTMPGGVWSPSDSSGGSKLALALAVAQPPPPPPAGTPVLAGTLAFDGFVISNTLAFICSTLATFSLVYCGVATVDIQKRFELVSFSLALLLCSARSFCAALAFALFLLLNNVEHGTTAIASCVITSLALLDGLWFLLVSFNDTAALLFRRTRATLFKLAIRFLAHVIYVFWPYLILVVFMVYDFLK